MVEEAEEDEESEDQLTIIVDLFLSIETRMG